MPVDFEVFADYQKIQQILYNLISNAIKYSPENNNVDISIRANDETFKIAIHDNGIGIDKNTMEKSLPNLSSLTVLIQKKKVQPA